MMLLTSLLGIAAAFFAFNYLSLRKSIQRLHQDILKKKKLRTNLLLTNPRNKAVMTPLIEEVNEIFQELKEWEIMNQHEKQALDLAIHNITHDIRTPLTIASGYTQKLLKNDQKQSEMIIKIYQNLEIVAKRLQVLLDYQNLLESAVQPNFQQVNFSRVVKTSLLDCYEALTDQQIQVVTSIEDDIWIENDPEIVSRILQNVLGNVLKHGRGQAEVVLKKEGHQVVLIISNQVQQVIRNLGRLTTRFYSENMSETEESSGLGLYITKELVELTRGTLAMEGTDTFTIILRWSIIK